MVTLMLLREPLKRYVSLPVSVQTGSSWASNDLSTFKFSSFHTLMVMSEEPLNRVSLHVMMVCVCVCVVCVCACVCVCVCVCAASERRRWNQHLLVYKESENYVPVTSKGLRTRISGTQIPHL